MKALKLVIFCICIFVCQNINAQIYFTEYDETIDKLIPKAKKNKLNEKQLELLTTSYHQANQEDHQEIMELKKSGEPDIWAKVNLRLRSIENRQNKIKTLPENIKTAMNFKPLNLEREIRNSREKEELYVCAKTNLLFENPTEENLNEVVKLMQGLWIVNPQSNNLDDLGIKYTILSSKQILFRIATPTELYLPDDFAQIALDFEETTIHNVPFDIVPDENKDYDLMIRIMIEEKTISPERINTATFEEKNGNKTAMVTDKTMSKSAGIIGKIEYIDVKNKKILINTPFDISSTFVHNYAEVDGDTDACSDETLQLINTQHTDYPSDEALLKDVARKLNQILKYQYQKK